MADVSKFYGTGHVCSDPQLKVGQDYELFTFRIAQNDYKGGSQFMNVKAWGNLASRMEKCIKKGSKIFVEGNLEIREFEHKGERRISVDISANSFEFVGGPPKKKEESKEIEEVAEPASAEDDEQPVTTEIPF